MVNVLTIREAVQRTKSDGMPVSEYTLRCWVKSGKIPVRRVGAKVLIFYPNLVSYLRCESGSGDQPDTVAVSAGGIRRIDA